MVRSRCRRLIGSRDRWMVGSRGRRMVWSRCMRLGVVASRGRCKGWGRRSIGSWLVGIGMMGVLGWVNEWVLNGVLVKLVEGHSFTTVDLIPELASKLVLIKQSAVRTNKSSASGTVTAIVTHSIHLTTSLRISVHARLKGSTGTAKLGVRSLSIAGIVNTSLARYTMLIMVLVMIRILVRSMVWSRLMVGWFRGMVWSRLMVCRLWSMVRGWLMICRRRRVIGSWLMISRGRLMVSRSRRVIGGWLMICRSGRTIRSWFMVSRSRRAVRSRLMISRGRRTVGRCLMKNWSRRAVRCWLIV